MKLVIGVIVVVVAVILYFVLKGLDVWVVAPALAYFKGWIARVLIFIVVVYLIGEILARVFGFGDGEGEGD